MQDSSLRLEYNPGLGLPKEPRGGASTPGRSPGVRAMGIALRLLALVAAALLPFFLIVRVAALAYSRLEVGAWTAMLLSGANAKTPEIREAYTELNPLLRLATGTVLLVDREAVVTDVDRTPADYLARGLSVNEASLHFEQDDGFVHAVDVRTVGRPEWKNRALEAYYRGMGFRTLRHVGTADHLHVSMPGR